MADTAAPPDDSNGKDPIEYRTGRGAAEIILTHKKIIRHSLYFAVDVDGMPLWHFDGYNGSFLFSDIAGLIWNAEKQLDLLFNETQEKMKRLQSAPVADLNAILRSKGKAKIEP